MRYLHVLLEHCVQTDGPTVPDHGFLWIDVLRQVLIDDPEAFRQTVESAVGLRLHDLHMQDAVNIQHPSYFDATSDYDMLVFRRLAPGPSTEAASAGVAHPTQRLHPIETRPIVFFIFDHVLITVRDPDSKTVEAMYARLLNTHAQTLPAHSVHIDKQRLPTRPIELALRLLNGMIDRYLELRQPLTDTLDRWQRDLLDPHQPFSRWSALLDARVELQRLEALFEDQYDAVQALRDSHVERSAEGPRTDALWVRMNDVLEHITRVLSHARRLQAAAESAVQLHFSAMAHRTNQIVRTLTVITAVFAPLALITGLFGMNFARMPLIDAPNGFWIIMGAMVGLTAVLLLFMWTKRYLSDRPIRHRH